MTKRLTQAALLMAAALSMSGCIAAAAAGAGVMIGDEMAEDDGKFDPLEKVFGNGDGKN